MFMLSMMFIVDNSEKFQSNSSLHCITRSHKDRLHIPTVKLSCIQKWVTYSALKVCNSLPLDIARLKNDNLNINVAI